MTQKWPTTCERVRTSYDIIVHYQYCCCTIRIRFYHRTDTPSRKAGSTRIMHTCCCVFSSPHTYFSFISCARPLMSTWHAPPWSLTRPGGCVRTRGTLTRRNERASRSRIELNFPTTKRDDILSYTWFKQSERATRIVNDKRQANESKRHGTISLHTTTSIVISRASMYVKTYWYSRTDYIRRLQQHATAVKKRLFSPRLGAYFPSDLSINV